MLKKNVASVYVNAFSNDFEDDAFVVIARQIVEAARAQAGSASAVGLIEASKTLGAKMMPGAIRIGLKAGVGQFVSDESINKVAEGAVDLLSRNAEELVRQRLTSGDSDQQAVNDFKRELTKLPRSLGSTGGRLVVIVDELDRCNPDFALAVLERIKHLFSADGVAFVLVMNREALEKLIVSRYGMSAGDTSYLQKFIDFEMRLKKSEKIIIK